MGYSLCSEMDNRVLRRTRDSLFQAVVRYPCWFLFKHFETSGFGSSIAYFVIEWISRVPSSSNKNAAA
jgi:hypothetical protein